MRPFVVALRSWTLILMGLVVGAGFLTLLGEPRGMGLGRSVPLLLVNVVEAIGLIVPFAALGAACTAQRRVGGRLPAVRTMITAALMIAGATILLGGFAAPALRRSVIANVYQAERGPRFDPRSLSFPHLLGAYSQSAALIASPREHVTTGKVGFEIYRRFNAPVLGFILTIVGWLTGWWISIAVTRASGRLIELGVVLFFGVSVLLTDYLAQGFPPTWANVVGVMIPGTALGALALLSWAANVWRRTTLTT